MNLLPAIPPDPFMISSVCLDSVPSLPFASLCRLLARPQLLFAANAIGTLLAFGTLDVMVQGNEHVTYAETAFAIGTVQAAPDTIAHLGP
jgi:hypothetical protein